MQQRRISEQHIQERAAMFKSLLMNVESNLLNSTPVQELVQQHISDETAYFQSHFVHCGSESTVFGDKVMAAVSNYTRLSYNLVKNQVYGMPDSLMSLGNPTFISHRGSSSLYPENTLTAFTAAAADGSPVLEMDVRLTRDGVPVIMHDATVTRVTSATGQVSSFDANAWKTLLTDPEVWLGFGYTPARPPFLSEIFDNYGKSNIIQTEAKSPGSGQAIVKLAQSKGIQPNRLVVSSFIPDELKPAINAGYGALLLSGNLSLITDWKAIADQGIKFVAYQNDETGNDARITTAHELGIRIFKWGITRRSQVLSNRQAGLDGVSTDDFPYLNSTLPMSLTDTFSTGKWMPGMTAFVSRGELFKDDGSWGYSSTATQFMSTVMGWACPTEPSYEMEFDLAMTKLDNDDKTRWASVFIGSDDDSVFTASPANKTNGYHLVIRGDGVMLIYKKTTGQAVTLIGKTTSSALTLGTYTRYRIKVEPETITLTRLDENKSVAVTDKDYRGGYVHMGRAGAAIKVKNIKFSW
jgi:glycerophosphoryl diester phosphodiesterase